MIKECARCGGEYTKKTNQGLPRYCNECHKMIRCLRERDRRDREAGNCRDCGIKISKIGATHCNKCAAKLRGLNRRGEDHPLWRGEDYCRRGYLIIYKGLGKIYPRHRQIWEEAYGIKLPDTWVVHHRNGLITDNRISNLQAMSNGAHTRLHHLGKRNGILQPLVE